MDQNRKSYAEYAESKAPRTPFLRNSLRAFLSGGLICAAAEGLFRFYTVFGGEEETARTWVSITLIFLAALLTGIGVFDKIAKHCGAGTLVPITGFANAVASPALDNRTEGFITGLGVKLFSVAGPVIVFGTLASVLYGTVLFLWGLFL